MLGITKRRVLSGATAVVASAALVFVGGTSAYADATELAPVIPAAASAAEGICVAAGVETLGTACAVAGVGLLAVGAWWAFSNADTIMSWVNPVSASDGAQAAPSTSPFAFPPNVPLPGAGPVDTSGWASAAPFGAYQTRATSSGVGLTAFSWCINSAGVISGPINNGGGSGSSSMPYTVVAPTIPCQSAGLKVVQYQWGDPNHGGNCAYGFGCWETWTAGGTWATTTDTTVNVTCTTPGGGSTTTTSMTTAPTAAVGSTTNVTVPHCAAGTYTSNVTVNQGPHGFPAAAQQITSWHTTGTPEATYPACFTGSSPGLAGCLLAVTYQGTACTSSVSACQNWQQSAKYGMTGYGCLWGPYTIPIASCSPLANAYKPGSITDPQTGLPTDPNATPSASASAAGGTIPTAGTNPNPAPSSSTWYSVQPFPSTSGQPVPEPPPTVGPAPGAANCMAAMWSWDPINWVVVPVECALTWAFVPDQAVMQQTVTDMGNHWHSSATGTFVDGAFGMFATLGNLTAGDAQACGLVVDFPYAQGHTQELRLLDSCTAPMSTYAPWVKGFLSAMLLFDGIYACVRALGIGFGIGVPPKMGQLDLFSQN